MTNFKNELKKLLKDFYIKRRTNGNDVVRVLDESAQAIIELVERELPKKKDSNIADALRAGTYNRGYYEKVAGYNQAINDMRAILRGEK